MNTEKIPKKHVHIINDLNVRDTPFEAQSCGHTDSCIIDFSNCGMEDVCSFDCNGC
jgi:hypothetical protein